MCGVQSFKKNFTQISTLRLMQQIIKQFNLSQSVCVSDGLRVRESAPQQAMYSEFLLHVK